MHLILTTLSLQVESSLIELRLEASKFHFIKFYNVSLLGKGAYFTLRKSTSQNIGKIIGILWKTLGGHDSYSHIP